MSVHGNSDVRFDFEGSLELARKLWSLADGYEATAKKRYATAGTALEQWRGPFTSLFVARVGEEVSLLNQCAALFRENARQWAGEWKTVMDENNRRRRARRVTELTHELRNKRSNTEKTWDFFAGDDSAELAEERTPPAREVALPTAPGFAPTDAPQQF